MKISLHEISYVKYEIPRITVIRGLLINVVDVYHLLNAAHLTLVKMSVSKSQFFLRPMEHCPNMAALKSPKQNLMEQLGLNGS